MKIAVTSKTLSNRVDFVKWLNQHFDEVRLNNSSGLRDDDLISFLDGCEYVVLGTEPFHKDVVSKSSLKAVFKYGVGIDNIDFEACIDKGLPVYFRKGTNSDAVAEIALSYIIQLLRNQHISFSSARNRTWNKQTGKELADAKIGILGYGNIGQSVEKKIIGVSNIANVVFNDRKSDHKGQLNYEPVEEMFKTCDIVTIHIDNEDRSNGNFVSEKLIAYIVNTARGSVLDYKALYNNLHRLGGIALDVYPGEPQIPDFLLDSNKTILSCHICGSSETGLKNGENFIKRSILEHCS